MLYKGHGYGEPVFWQTLNSDWKHIWWLMMSWALLEKKSCCCCRVIWGLMLSPTACLQPRYGIQPQQWLALASIYAFSGIGSSKQQTAGPDVTYVGHTAREVVCRDLLWSSDSFLPATSFPSHRFGDHGRLFSHCHHRTLNSCICTSCRSLLLGFRGLALGCPWTGRDIWLIDISFYIFYILVSGGSQIDNVSVCEHRAMWRKRNISLSLYGFVLVFIWKGLH